MKKKKQCCSHTMGYYSAVKRDELLNDKKIGKKFKCILLRERIQSEKAAYCIIPIIWHSGKGKTTEIVKRSVVARGSGGGRKGWIGGAKEVSAAYPVWHGNDGYMSTPREL